MTNEEIVKALCRVAAEIAEREKKKAIQNEEYDKALLAGFAEGISKEVEKCIQ